MLMSSTIEVLHEKYSSWIPKRPPKTFVERHNLPEGISTTGPPVLEVPEAPFQTIIIEYSPMDLHKLDGATLQMRIPSGHGDRWWPWWGHVLMGHVQFNVS